MNKHILVTEDDKNVADGLREILESDGYTVSCADCASAAMQTMHITAQRALPKELLQRVQDLHISAAQLLQPQRKTKTKTHNQ